eukprot:gene12653-12780_t
MVDPITGQVISKTSVINKAAGYTVDAGGVAWAYRKSTPAKETADTAKREVLLLHGLGSSSYSYRSTLAMLEEAGFQAYAPDWPGHGSSSKPSSSSFDYSQEAYINALDAFVEAIGIKKPFALVVQGYVLGQYGLLYALRHEENVDRLFILNTPLALNSKLRLELAAYKNPIPFLRPGNKPFDGTLYNMTGSKYAMLEADALTYGEPYQDPAASAAIAATMDQLDFSKVLKEVDDGYRTWRKPSLLLFGANDPFIDVKNPFAFLESKRTNMRLVTATAKLGHMPQEDYAEAIQDTIELFLLGETDAWEPGRVVSARMTKKGVVEAGVQ